MPARRFNRSLVVCAAVAALGAAGVVGAEASELQTVLLAPDGEAYGSLGYSVALDDGSAVVGAVDDGTGGSAYVWAGADATWELQSELAVSGLTIGAEFGYSVDIDGDTAVVGARYQDVGEADKQGAAYVFTRTADEWSLQTQLIASDGLEDDEFGISVAVEGDTVMVAAANGGRRHGAVYVFTRTGAAWAEDAQLVASDGAPGDLFGSAIVIDGDTALIGARFDTVDTQGQGSAYVFTRDGATWSEDAKLTTRVGGDSFGKSVALDGDTAVVGASGGDFMSRTSAHVFVRRGSTWSEQALLGARRGEEGDGFGSAVAVSGDTVLVGAFFADVKGVIYKGAAYVFTRVGTKWRQTDRLTSDGRESVESFGWSVALEGDTALIGAIGYDGPRASQGAAIVFDLGTVP